LERFTAGAFRAVVEAHVAVGRVSEVTSVVRKILAKHP
jgi:hypothetical protein